MVEFKAGEALLYSKCACRKTFPTIVCYYVTELIHDDKEHFRWFCILQSNSLMEKIPCICKSLTLGIVFF